MLNRVEIRRVGGQLFYRQTIRMPLEKCFHRLAGVITGTILNHYQVLRRLRHDIEQKFSVALRVEAPGVGLVEKLSGEIVNEAKDLICLAFAARWNLGLLASGCPGITERAPLSKTGFIAKE